MFHLQENWKEKNLKNIFGRSFFFFTMVFLFVSGSSTIGIVFISKDWFFEVNFLSFRSDFHARICGTYKSNFSLKNETEWPSINKEITRCFNDNGKIIFPPQLRIFLNSKANFLISFSVSMINLFWRHCQNGFNQKK